MFKMYITTEIFLNIDIKELNGWNLRLIRDETQVLHCLLLSKHEISAVRSITISEDVPHSLRKY